MEKASREKINNHNLQVQLKESKEVKIKDIFLKDGTFSLDSEILHVIILNETLDRQWAFELNLR